MSSGLSLLLFVKTIRNQVTSNYSIRVVLSQLDVYFITYCTYSTLKQ